MRQLDNQATYSSAVCFRRVSNLEVRFLYMSSRFNGCKRSQRDRLETAIFRSSFRTTASSLGGSLSCRRKYICRVLWVCLCVWILCPSQVWEGFSEAAGAVVSRFESAFLSVARGARLSSPTRLGSLV
ncbi:unnamed protein product [Brassica rapa subsp. narinosa]